MFRDSWGLRREDAFGETFLVEARIEMITAALYSRGLALPSRYHTMTPCRGVHPTGPGSLFVKDTLLFEEPCRASCKA